MRDQRSGLGDELEVVEGALRALWSRASRASVVIDAGLVVVQLNAAFATLVGEPAEKIVGRGLFDVAPLGVRLRPAIAAVAAGAEAATGLRLPGDWGDVTMDATPFERAGARYVVIEVAQLEREAFGAAGSVPAIREMFTDLSRRLARASGSGAREAISYGLRVVCEAYDIDRAYVRLLTDDERYFVLTHQYHRPSLEPWAMVRMEVENLGWAHGRFLAGLPVALTDFDEMPPEARAFGETLRAAGVTSTVGVPVLHGPVLLGYVAWVHHVRRTWAAPLVDRLQLSAEMIAGVIAREAAEDELRDRIVFEETLTSAAARFVNLEPEQVDAEIVRTLGAVGESRRLDRAALFALDDAAGALALTHEWCADGVPSVRDAGWCRDVDDLPRSLRRALDGEVIVAREEDVRAGSDDAELLERMGVHGFVFVPLAVGGGARRVLMLQILKHRRQDADLATARSRLIADVLSDALARKARTEEARAHRRRFERVLETSMDGIVVVDTRAVVVEWTAQAATVFGRAARAIVGRQFAEAIHVDDRAALRQHLDAVLAETTRSAARLEVRAITEDDRVVPVELSATHFDSPDGIFVAAFVRDITDRRRTEADRQRTLDEAQRLRQTAERERDYLREQDAARPDVLGDSPAIRAALSLVEAVAETDATVLLSGESGVGKECFARLLHTSSHRAGGPFVRVNCASIPSTLFESEFFGHAKGSFTGAHKDRAGRFELADGGTLLLDEVGEIPLDLQAKLLRVLQEGEFERVGEDRTRKLDVRVVAATNRDLASEAAAGKFRPDLYFRLGVFPIRVPPLRERGEDVGLLARHFLARHAARLRRPGLSLTKDHEAQLLAYDWPGNVRELDHVIERAAILSKTGALRLDLALPGGAARLSTIAPSALLREEDLRRIERENLEAALTQANGRVSGPGGAAELLGMRPSTARDRMKALGIAR